MRVEKGEMTGSDLLLLLVAAIWGGAFVAQRSGMVYVGPFTFNTIRFAVGGVALIPLVRHLRAFESLPGSWRGGLLLGFLLFGGATLQQIGLVWTTAGKAGFITGLYVVLVPLLLRLFWGEKASLWTWICAMLALLGLFLLSVEEDWHLAVGDGWVLGGAFLWAMHVIAVGRLAKGYHPVHLAMVQFLTCAGLSLGPALGMETLTPKALVAALPALGYAAFLSTAGAYTLQLIAQRRAPPARAGLVLSSESLFAALFGFLFLGEHLTFRQGVGAALIFLAILLVQVEDVGQ